jgi:hypothetical protein
MIHSHALTLTVSYPLLLIIFRLRTHTHTHTLPHTHSHSLTHTHSLPHTHSASISALRSQDSQGKIPRSKRCTLRYLHRTPILFSLLSSFLFFQISFNDCLSYVHSLISFSLLPDKLLFHFISFYFILFFFLSSDKLFFIFLIFRNLILNLICHYLILACTCVQPILADPADRAGLEEEESRNIFLLQLPSQLK